MVGHFHVPPLKLWKSHLEGIFMKPNINLPCSMKLHNLTVFLPLINDVIENDTYFLALNHNYILVRI